MIISDNFVSDFYKKICCKNIRIFVNDSVDGICALKIFTALLSSDSVSFTFVAVHSWSNLVEQMESTTEEGAALLLINCGGNRSLRDIKVPDDTIIYVLDSRRVIHLENVHNSSNISVLIPSQELPLLNLPAGDTIFRTDDYNEGSDSDGSADAYSSTRNTRHDIWENNKKQILSRYYEYSWFSPASSIFMIELAQSLSKARVEFLWCAVVALSAQFIDKEIGKELYIITCAERLATLIQKYCCDKNNLDRADGKMRLTFDIDLMLPLYRHWSFYESMANSERYIAKAKLHTQAGEHNMKDILRNLEILLDDAHNDYHKLPNDVKKDVLTKLVVDQGTKYHGFTAHYGSFFKYNSCDFARILSDLYGHGSAKSTLTDRLIKAYGLLSNFIEDTSGQKGVPFAIANYKVSLEKVTELAYNYLNTANFFCMGNYCMIKPYTSLDLSILQSPHFFSAYAGIIKRCYSSSKKNKNRMRFPIIFEMPCKDSLVDFAKIVGHMPVVAQPNDDGTLLNIMSTCFENVISAQPNIQYKQESFDRNVIYINLNHRHTFYSAVEVFLEKIKTR